MTVKQAMGIIKKIRKRAGFSATVEELANYREAETCLHCGRAVIVSAEMILCPIITKNNFRVDAQTGCDWYTAKDKGGN
jgi:hypothetical protein